MSKFTKLKCRNIYSNWSSGQNDCRFLAMRYTFLLLIFRGFCTFPEWNWVIYVIRWCLMSGCWKSEFYQACLWGVVVITFQILLWCCSTEKQLVANCLILMFMFFGWKQFWRYLFVDQYRAWLSTFVDRTLAVHIDNPTPYSCKKTLLYQCKYTTGKSAIIY